MPNVPQTPKSLGIAKGLGTVKLKINTVKINVSGFNANTTKLPLKGQRYPRSKTWKVG